MADKSGMEVFEVFSQRTPTSGFVHQHSLLAPNHEMAMLMARENFLRREPCYNIWVVKRDDIFVLPPDQRPILERLDNKSYRETKGYGYLKKKWRQYDQESFEEQMAKER